MSKHRRITNAEKLLLLMTVGFLALLLVQYTFLPADVEDGYTVTPQLQTEPVPVEESFVNVNTATEEELDELEGIGPVLAGAIVKYRQEHGPFRTMEELLEVDGIGEKTLETLREQVVLEEKE